MLLGGHFCRHIKITVLRKRTEKAYFEERRMEKMEGGHRKDTPLKSVAE